MASIFDVFGRLLLDDAKFEADATKTAQRTGDKVGTTMSARMGTAMKAGLVGVGAAGGALFGIAAKGGAELTATVAAYRAETGATAEEAEAAQDSIASLYRNNINGFDELGGVLASVKTNLGLTGEAGEQAAQRILDYAKVTGQDAVGAVEALDDITDSWNLTEADHARVLDQLVAGHQKFGGSVEDNQATLAALAPAMRAANMSIEDGTALLNLFGSKGLDAGQASAAFSKALTKVESPEELQQLIDDISATEDPFLRSQKAADLFGAKAGTKLANALGGVNLEDFAIGMDEAAGSVERASEVIDNEPFTKLKLVLKNLAGPLAEAGTAFGPLVLGFSQLGGPRLIGAVTTGLGGLAGKVLPALVPALMGLVPALGGVMATIGSALGGLLAAAIPIGMALLPVILIAALVAAIAFLVMNPEIVAKIGEVVGGILEAIGNFLKDLPAIFLRAFDMAMEAVGTVLGALPGILGNVLAALPGILAQVPGMIVAVLGKLVELWAAAWGAILQIVIGLVGRIVGFVLGIPGKVAGMFPQVGAFFANLAAQAASTIAAGVGQVVGFILSIPGRVASLVGSVVAFFTSIAQRAAAIVSGFVAQVVAFVLSIPGRIAGLLGSVASLFGNIASRVSSTISSLVGKVVSFFLSIPGKIAALGGRIVGSIINGMASLPGKLANVIRNAFANLRIDIGPFHISGSGITIDMPNISLPSFHAGGRPEPGQVALIGEEGPELWVPDQAGTILPHGAFASMALPQATGGGGTTYNLSTYGLPQRAETPVEVVHQLRRSARLGGITPPRRAPSWGSAR